MLHLHPREIDLVVSDVSMPEVDGLTLVMGLWAEQPNLPVLLMSGCYENVDLDSRRTYKFLPKPFDLTTLLNDVRQLMAKRPWPWLPEQERALVGRLLRLSYINYRLTDIAR
jgi:DNA-binding NtrC family response regulator